MSTRESRARKRDREKQLYDREGYLIQRREFRYRYGIEEEINFFRNKLAPEQGYLKYAVHTDNFKLLQLILEPHGAWAKELEEKGSPLLSPPLSKRMTNFLLKRGFDPLVRCEDQNKNTPLHILAGGSFENTGAVEALIENGVDLNVTNSKGETALHHAFMKDIIHLLVQNGITIDEKDSEGRTALHLAVFICHAPKIETLIELGCDVNAQDDKGQTALHLACKYHEIHHSMPPECIQDNQIEMIKMLLKGGACASLTISNNDGKIPCDLLGLNNKYVKDLIEQAMESASLHGFKR